MRITRVPKPRGPRSSWKLRIRIMEAASTLAVIQRGICGILAPTIPGGSDRSVSAAATFDYHYLMSIDQTSRFHYRLGLNQPAGSPTVNRLTEMAGAIRAETGG